jgi:PKHD-type hydroxylase
MQIIRKRGAMLVLAQVLEPEDVARVVTGLAGAALVDGKATAGPQARAVKHNLQARGVEPLGEFVAAALRRHPLFTIAARPARLSPLLFSRYTPGMTYGWHTDDAIMGEVRTDLAFTLFLSAPETYDGGALTVQTALGEQEIKLAAGDAVLYAAGSIHQVAPVTRGERLACVGWIESLVAGAEERATLFDLSLLRSRLAAASLDQADLLVLDKAISNLLRLWARR